MSDDPLVPCHICDDPLACQSEGYCGHGLRDDEWEAVLPSKSNLIEPSLHAFLMAAAAALGLSCPLENHHARS